MTNRAEFERLLDVYGFRCERFGQDLSTHARAQVVSAFTSLASAPVADERAAFITWLTDSYPNAYSEPEAVRLWHHGHVSALAWKERGRRAALASAPVADESPMAKMADALREKARQERQAYQDSRVQTTEWGPMPEGTEADDPSALAALADGLESIKGNENAAMAATYIRAQADRLASAPVAMIDTAKLAQLLDSVNGDCYLGKEKEEELAQFLRSQLRAPVAGEAVSEDIERMAVNRYRPVPDRVFGYKVVAGDGNRSLHTGTKEACYLVARKLTEAFLDGAFVASNAAPQVSEAVRDAYERGYRDGLQRGDDQIAGCLV